MSTKTGKAKMLKTRCHFHPRYTAVDKPPRSTMCSSCLLLYVLRWQFDKEADKHLGSLNPYVHFLSGVDLAEANAGIEVKP